jgi:hypothetical protein
MEFHTPLGIFDLDYKDRLKGENNLYDEVGKVRLRVFRQRCGGLESLPTARTIRLQWQGSLPCLQGLSARESSKAFGSESPAERTLRYIGQRSEGCHCVTS